MLFTQAQRHFRGFTDGLLQLVYPPSCAFCHCEVESSAQLLCAGCKARLADSSETNCCWRCASTLGPHAGTPEGCDICGGVKFAFLRVLRLGSYDDDLRTACLQLKGFHGHYLSKALAGLLVDRQRSSLTGTALDAVVSVPLHWSRTFWRGYDQSAQLAEQIARLLSLPVLHGTLQRKRRTPHQASVPYSQRRANVRDAFQVRSGSRLHGKRILLVDDILTSGATCHYAAKALKGAGATEVTACVLARGRSKVRS